MFVTILTEVIEVTTVSEGENVFLKKFFWAKKFIKKTIMNKKKICFIFFKTI